LKVLLQILNGKSLQIMVKGMTLSSNEGRMAIWKNQYELPHTPIGLLVPVKFPIAVSNVGMNKISYKTKILEKNVKREYINSKFNIFEVENPEG